MLVVGLPMASRHKAYNIFRNYGWRKVRNMNQFFSASSERGIRAIALLLFFSAFSFYLLGNGSHSLWDRDETRFSEATREMIVSRDWVIPHLNEKIRYDKPVMIYWLMSVPMRLWGPNAFAARFVSSLAGSATVLLIFLFALRMGCDKEGSLLAAMTAMLTVLPFCISKAATTDSVLTMTVVAAMFLYWQQLRNPFLWSRHFAFWAILAFSALVKGPVGPAIVGLGIICEKTWRSFTQEKYKDSRLGETEFFKFSFQSGNLNPAIFLLLRTLAGIALFLVIGLPWAIQAALKTSGGVEKDHPNNFILTAIQHHVIDRMFQSFEGHSGGFLSYLPGGAVFYYIPVVMIGVFPLFALILLAARWTWKKRNTLEGRFLFSWFLPGFLMFSLVSTKLPHYSAPLLPALALMGGLWWTRCSVAEKCDAEALGSKTWRWFGRRHNRFHGFFCMGGSDHYVDP